VVVALSFALTLFELAVLEGGCLPQEDLSSYSSARESQPAAPDGANDAAVEADGGAGGVPSAGSGGSIIDVSDAGVAGRDASSPPAAVDSGAATEPDASAALVTDAANALP
jgi:hypothetical protein